VEAKNGPRCVAGLHPKIHEVAAAVVRDDPGLTEQVVKDFLKDELASYKKPRRVVFVDELPRNALGKVLKHEVREELTEPNE
jgi:malonyl-CoA/methylmalonyl-CoA synthetase